jgi:sugar/nucleoside kinase (ribokinase family)
VVVVIGALALDVVACRRRFLPATSNPSDIRWAPGGVGYRIWRHLPAPKLLITAVGEDPAGRWLTERLGSSRGAGRHGARLLALPRQPTACYTALMQDGRLLYGAADMRIIERGLTWRRVAPLLPDLGMRDLLVLEANLAPELVSRLIRRFGGHTRLVFESVSIEKLLRHQESLRDLYLLSANREELAALRARQRLVRQPGGRSGRRSGSSRRGEGWPRAFLEERRIARLLEGRGRLGVRLYALGAGGRMRVAEQRAAHIVRTLDTTGAGDLLLAAVLARLGRGGSPELALPAAVREVEKAIEEGRL